MGIVSVFCIGIRKEVCPHSAIEWLPIRAFVLRFEDAATGHADIHMLGIARIDQDGMKLRPVRRSVLIATAPCLALRMFVEAVDAMPVRAAIIRAEQPLRRSAGIPCSWLAGMSRGEP